MIPTVGIVLIVIAGILVITVIAWLLWKYRSRYAYESYMASLPTESYAETASSRNDEMLRRQLESQGYTDEEMERILHTSYTSYRIREPKNSTPETTDIETFLAD